MKNSLYILMIALVLLLTACGGSSDNGSNNENLDNKGGDPEDGGIVMQINEPYIVNKGQTIIKDSETAMITLETEFATGKTTAVLKSGKATIK